eukprot:SAG31_NODE_26680_length_438_cov_0.820059_2_plen_85_part_01
MSKYCRSGYISDGNGVGLENAGMIAVVNEWCLQSHESTVIRVFETLPVGHAVRFHRLAAQGGFLVSAAINMHGEFTNFTVELPLP